MTKHTRWIVRLICLGYVAALTLLLLSPNPGWWLGLWFPPGCGGGIGIHFATFLTLGVLVGASRLPLRTSTLIGLLLCYAVSMEVLQLFSPPRTVELKDFIENLLGLATGLTLWRLVVREPLVNAEATANDESAKQDESAGTAAEHEDD